jgi:hypothetical protein
VPAGAWAHREHGAGAVGVVRAHGTLQLRGELLLREAAGALRSLRPAAQPPRHFCHPPHPRDSERERRVWSRRREKSDGRGGLMA